MMLEYLCKCISPFDIPHSAFRILIPPVLLALLLAQAGCVQRYDDFTQGMGDVKPDALADHEPGESVSGDGIPDGPFPDKPDVAEILPSDGCCVEVDVDIEVVPADCCVPDEVGEVDVAPDVVGGPKILVVVPAVYSGESSGGKWTLRPRSPGGAAAGQSSTGEQWKLTGAVVGGGE